MLKELLLIDWRNHARTRVEINSGATIIYGPNGSGKTNIIEAISVLSVGKSWRERSKGLLMREGSDSGVIRATYEEDLYEIQVQPRSFSVEKNSKKQSLKSHMGSIPTLLFAPEHLHIFRGTKAERMGFLDRFLYQISPTYRAHLSITLKAIRSRNTLLKADIPPHRNEIEPWEIIIAEHLPMVTSARMEIMKQLTPLLQKAYRDISTTEEMVDMQLKIGEDYTPTTEGINEFFDTNRQREMAARRTLVTPTRDDIVFFLRGKTLTSTASRGEERSALLSLLTAMRQHMNTREMAPIMLLDDVFSELDDTRQQCLSALCEGCQTIITTTHAEHFRAFAGATAIAIHDIINKA